MLYFFLRDHPRVCGEKSKLASGHIEVKGSPPRVRGKVEQKSTLFAKNGITPACAGKRSHALTRRITTGDHPRVCGEKKNVSLTKNRLAGSPPRMRGKATTSSLPFPISGITPAYAGKRKSLKPVGVRIWDHPRVCGEKPKDSLARILLQGSPPRMRGKGQSIP